jgi:hypothetical protein
MAVYEQRSPAVLPRSHFLRPLLRHFAPAALLLLLSLWLGVAGYQHASLRLGGMGAVNNPVTPDGKLFAGCYALFAGIVFIVTASIILAPVLHRMLHLFHCDECE